MIKKIIKRFKDDNGNPVYVLGIALLAATLMVGGMMLDITKAYQFKSAYTDSAKKATQAGIRIQNSRGHLTTSSIVETVRVYEIIARPSVMKVSDDAYFSRCGVQNSGSGAAPRNMKVVLGNIKENGSLTIGTTVTLDLDKVKKIRDDELKKSTPTSPQSMNNKIREAFASQIDTSSFRKKVRDGQYNYIHIEIYESTPNTILPAALSVSGSDGESMRCQTMGIQASASQYVELGN